MVLSLLHVAKYCPSELHAAHLTSFSCPSSCSMHSKPASPSLHMHVVPSKLALASSLPLGCHARLLTVLLCKSVSVCYNFHSVSMVGTLMSSFPS